MRPGERVRGLRAGGARLRAKSRACVPSDRRVAVLWLWEVWGRSWWLTWPLRALPAEPPAGTSPSGGRRRRFGGG